MASRTEIGMLGPSRRQTSAVILVLHATRRKRKKESIMAATVAEGTSAKRSEAGLQRLEAAAKDLGVYLILDALRHERARQRVISSTKVGV